MTVAVAAVATAGTLAHAQGDLGFLQSWFGAAAGAAGPSTAASWSQRLIYAYVGGRVFLDRPLLGTGWHGELPPAEFAEYLPDARERFSDEPPHYFPATDRDFIPQQTYDQVLFQLGLVGAGALRRARRARRLRAPRSRRADAASGDARLRPGELAGGAARARSPARRSSAARR